MIKNIAITCLVFFVTAFAFTSCNKVDCAELVNAITTGAKAYDLNKSIANCQNYKKALQAWLDESKCADENAVQTNIYKSTLVSMAVICP